MYFITGFFVVTLECFSSPVQAVKKTSVRIGVLNVRSLISSYEEVCLLLVGASMDVLALTETWLEDSDVCPVGYSIVRKDRNRNGGGVAFIVSERVRYKPRIDLCNGCIESISIELYPTSKRSMLFCCTYKPPSCNCVDYYEELSLEYEQSKLFYSW